jgi:hypothetical protein
VKTTGSALLALFAVGAAGCGATDANDPAGDPPATVTFSLHNGGATPVYLYEQCILKLTITQVAEPARVIGLLDGCPVCDCGDTQCQGYLCGACFMGGVEVAANAMRPFTWSAVDVDLGTQNGRMCMNQQTLPAGQYRIDVPVYPTPEDAMARANPRLVTQTFQVPADQTIVVPLAASSP